MVDSNSQNKTLIGTDNKLAAETLSHDPEMANAADRVVVEMSDDDRFQATRIFEPVAAALGEFAEEHSGSEFTASHAGAHIGRYQILGMLGAGGFGKVFLATDSELDRRVAIKLPHRHRIEQPEFRQMYLTEAKTLAKLDHPFIVPIYDCGVIPDGRCFVVSKYIDGRDLSHRMLEGSLGHSEIARLLTDVTEALHFVHQARVVHRDIKPANLLLGNDGRIYIADFGLALGDDPSLSYRNNAGTPNYMSPEQVRGEGHRVDGRSDQFSLGVVMYELLTGARPFASGASHDVMHRVLTVDPVPPHLHDPGIPAELSRICMKLLSKLASHRYAITSDLAVDLRDWLESVARQLEIGSAGPSQTTIVRVPQVSKAAEVTKQTNVIPRGLRAFSRADADYFLDLLPGTRDRDGLPDSLSHWKRWVISREDSPDLQRVGVISGPTGCGKSSLVRAGLVPLLTDSALSNSVTTIVVEATVDLTERQLLHAIHRRNDFIKDASLPDALATIRRGQDVEAGRSLLIVIDQFEQWLHANPDPQDSALVRAIRQCDGIRVQCLLLVRDDFWLALSRFMEAVESPLQLGCNAMMIDVFDLRHARKVLIEFGRAFGRLPMLPTTLSREQDQFIDGAIDNLATDRKIIPVQLALFAEMVKSRDWNPATLRQLGGTVGIGAQFLNESFSATYAPVSQRIHEVSARKLLQALLPDPGTEIKANRRSRTELQGLSGYNDQSSFAVLMTILEYDLKLISATESLDRTKSESNLSTSDQTTYQLSHDFLVPSIREWLTAKQRASWRGRLHQRLSEATGLWGRQHDSRFLPGFWEWMQMRCLLPSDTLSAGEKSMLRARDGRSLITIICVAVLLGVSGFLWRRFQTQTQMDSLIVQLSTAKSDQVPTLIDDLGQFNSRAVEPLAAAVSRQEKDSQSRFVLQLARLKWTDEPLEEVFESTLSAPWPDFVSSASESLAVYAEQLTDRCWKIVEESTDDDKANAHALKIRRFRAAQLLARINPPETQDSKQRWIASSAMLSDLLLHACMRHPDQYQALAKSMQPAASTLIPPLSMSLGARPDDSLSRFAITLLAEYTKDDMTVRTRLCLDAVDWQEELMIPESATLDKSVLRQIADLPVDESVPELQQNVLARRKAVAATFLLSLPGEESDSLWNLLRRSPNSTVRTLMIEFLRHRNIPLSRIVARLQSETDPGLQAALILAIGDFDANDPDLTTDDRAFVVHQFRTASDAGVHSAAEWLLRKWGESKAISELPVGVESIASSQADATGSEWVDRQWIRTPHGHTLARIPGSRIEGLHRDFLMATHEVTVEQMHQFNPDQYVALHWAPTPDCPAHVIKWPDAVAYCNWLSRQEGLKPFYPSETAAAESFVAAEADYNGPGYRLPTTAEWKFACRSGSATDRFFGTDLSVIGRYGWFEGNSIRKASPSHEEAVTAKPTGLLRPNDFGLFDMFGNIDEWCNDPGQFGTAEREFRGGNAGGWDYSMTTNRTGSVPIRIEYNSIGFRICRTIAE